MTEETPKLTELLSSIPQIVITEPSPLVFSRKAENAAVEVDTPPTATTPETVEPTPAVEPVVPWSDTAAKETSGEFDPDRNQCKEEEKSPEVGMEIIRPISAVAPTGIEETDDVFRNIESDAGFLDRFVRYMNTFSESKFMLLINFLLLSMPISSGFMGAKYLDRCPLSAETPVFLFMMGIAGTIVIISKILLISQKLVLPRYREWQLLRVIIIVGNLAIIVCLATEMFSFFRKPPSFEIGTPNYCHETFYNFTYWMNWACVIVIALLVIVEMPKCSAEGLQAELAP